MEMRCLVKQGIGKYSFYFYGDEIFDADVIRTGSVRRDRIRKESRLENPDFNGNVPGNCQDYSIIRVAKTADASYWDVEYLENVRRRNSSKV